MILLLSLLITLLFYFATTLLHTTVARYWLCMKRIFVTLFPLNEYTAHLFSLVSFAI